MKIGYGTYGMQKLDVFEVLPRLRDIGYEAVELQVGDDWCTAPHKLDTAARGKLTEALKAQDFPPPVLMAGLAVCARGGERPAMLERFDEACILARDLNFADAPAVIVSTLGGLNDDWETEKGWICESLLELSQRLATHNVILGIEPHAGQIFDTPEKAAWVMQQTDHPCLKLNFDISHFHVLDIDMHHSIDLCAPYAAATHIKDGRMVDGKVQYQLPGDGSLDLAAYFKAVATAGLTVPITVEVTGQIWSRPDYDPWPAAESCFQALDRARQEAGLT